VTTDELKKRFPNASEAFIEQNADDYRASRPLPDPKPKRNKAAALGSTEERETKGMGSTLVSFVGYRTRPLDPDNFAGSVKDLLDGLRHSGLIPGDEPWQIELATSQVKVRSRNEEKTVIRITYP
jgi:hypothetical protein